jgi:hypothetical protein
MVPKVFASMGSAPTGVIAVLSATSVEDCAVVFRTVPRAFGHAASGIFSDVFDLARVAYGKDTVVG